MTSSYLQAFRFLFPVGVVSHGAGPGSIRHGNRLTEEVVLERDPRSPVFVSYFHEFPRQRSVGVPDRSLRLVIIFGFQPIERIIGVDFRLVEHGVVLDRQETGTEVITPEGFAAIRKVFRVAGNSFPGCAVGRQSGDAVHFVVFVESGLEGCAVFRNGTAALVVFEERGLACGVDDAGGFARAKIVDDFRGVACRIRRFQRPSENVLILDGRVAAPIGGFHLDAVLVVASRIWKILFTCSEYI